MSTLQKIITDLIWYVQINRIDADAQAPNLEADDLHTNDGFMITMPLDASSLSDTYVQQ